MKDSLAVNKQKEKGLAIFFGILSLLWMGVIFYMSSRVAVASTGDSMQIDLFLGTLFSEDFSTWDAVSQMQFIEAVDHFVRKGAHVAEYFVLGMLLYGTVYNCYVNHTTKLQRKEVSDTMLLSWGFATAYAMTDEIHQLFVEGRSCEFRDMCIDSLGAFLGVLCVFVFLRCRRKRKESKNRNVSNEF